MVHAYNMYCSLHLINVHFKKIQITILLELLSDTCINNGSKKIKKIKKNKHTFAWIWGLTGITFARRKSITIVHKMHVLLIYI
jgi:hypothetical protein